MFGKAYLVSAKRHSVVQSARHERILSAQQLHQLADNRATRVAVHDEVRAHAGLIERHVLLLDDDATHVLLSVTTAELVTELGPSEMDESGNKSNAWKTSLTKHSLGPHTPH